MLTILFFLAAEFAFAQSPCPAASFLDVSKYPGAGPQYPKPKLDAACNDGELIVRSNGIPHYEFIQVTPNPLKAQNYEFRVPLNPKRAEKPVPLPLLGSAGFAVNGTVFYGPNEGPQPAAERFGDPIFNMIMDACMGHTALEYHYHAMVQRCLSENAKDGELSPILGFAYDGFPIHGPWGCIDKECKKVVKFKSSWERIREPHIFSWDAYQYVKKSGEEYLDACNGRVGPDGKYRYHVTETWPYIIGCYAGDPVGLRNRGRQGPPPGRRPSDEQVLSASKKLGIPLDKLVKALRMEAGGVKPMNFAASAYVLGVEEPKLREALEFRGGPPPPRVNQAAPGEPECFFRCGKSSNDAVGCTLTPDHKVVCKRPCDGNKCG